MEGVEPLDADPLPNGKGFHVVALGNDEPYDVFVVGPEGGKPRRIPTEGMVRRTYFVVSPDGEQIVYIAKGGRLKLAPLGQGRAREVPGSPLDLDEVPIQWSADSRFLYVLRKGVVPALVSRLDLETGKKVLWKELMPPNISGIISVSPVIFARDGKSYAYSYGRVVASDLYVLSGLK